MHELLIKVHDILDNAMFMTFWTMPCPDELGIPFVLYHMCLILLAGSIMRSGLHSYPSFTVSKNVVPPSEACLYGCMNWSLAQDQQQSSMGLSRSFPSKERWQSHFYVQKRPVPGSSGASFSKRPLLESGNEAHPGGKKAANGSVPASSAEARKK